MTGIAPGDHVGWQSTSPLRGHALAELGASTGEEVAQRLTTGRATGGHGVDVELLLAGQRGQRLQGGHVTDSGQNRGGAEQRKEPVGTTGPSLTCLGEVLEARQRGHALAASLAHQGGQVGDGGDVGHLVEGEEYRRWPDVLGAASAACRSYAARRMSSTRPTTIGATSA